VLVCGLAHLKAYLIGDNLGATLWMVLIHGFVITGNGLLYCISYILGAGDGGCM